jgi:hypothetical protein
VALEGVCIAPDDPTLEPDPTWLRLDDGFTRVASYQIDRGRQYELDQTDGGRAVVTINDVDGELDPTNSSGSLYGKLEPLMQAGIARWNPVTETWHSRFRGFVEEFDYTYDPSQRVSYLSLSLVDIYEILQTVQMQQGAFGDPPPNEVLADGDVFFEDGPVDVRIRQVYTDAGIPDDFFVVFSGNVDVYESTYSAGETALTAIQEAVDAEFPTVSNFYPDRFGRGVFHGRLAKFDPTGTAASTTPDQWTYLHLHAGDGAYVDADPDSRVQLRELGFNRGTSKVLNYALASPVGIRDKDIPDQLVQDLVSIGLRGFRAWTRENLLTMTGLLDSSDALTETKRFATYIVDNYAQPRNRITSIGFRPLHDLDPRAVKVWQMLCDIDIADRVDVTVAGPGGGGFSEEPYFVEGVHEDVRGRVAGSAGYTLDDVTLTLDLSPMALFTSNPWGDT